MSEYAGQDSGAIRVTIREAAARLGVTEAAVRKRIQRGSLGKELGQDGRVYVYLDLSQDTSHPESQLHRDPVVEELVEELRDRVAFLERSLERRSLEAERYQQIVAGLTQTNNNLSVRVLELEGPREASGATESPEAPETVEEEQERVEPRSDTAEARRGAQRPWWKRFFGN